MRKPQLSISLAVALGYCSVLLLPVVGASAVWAEAINSEAGAEAGIEAGAEAGTQANSDEVSSKDGAEAASQPSGPLEPLGPLGPPLAANFPTAPAEVKPIDNDFGVPGAHESLLNLRKDTKQGLTSMTSKSAKLVDQLLSKQKKIEMKWAAEKAAAAEAGVPMNGTDSGGESAQTDGEAEAMAGGEALDIEGADSSIDAPPSEDAEQTQDAIEGA